MFIEIIQMHFDKLQLAMQKFATMWGGLDLTKIDRLEAILPVWLGILESRVASHEYNNIALLDSVAWDITHTHWPMTQLVTLETKLHLYYTEHMVVKHEDSTSRQFMKYTTKQKHVNEAKKYGNGDHHLFMQPYVPEWDKVGQWHCFMVGGGLLCIFTHPGSYMLANRNAPVWARGLQKDGWNLNELNQ
ncbi:hypothetical protein BDR04DRAFT_1118338 [Suillus decipiens]|nr:hypothetical protein BDR04DRAFT_1118338 [Suillus decipiens]